MERRPASRVQLPLRFVVAAFLFNASLGLSQTRVGDQFQVNSYTTDAQLFPDVAAGAGGDFVVVWHGYGGGADTGPYSIQGQRYNPGGEAVGTEFQINSFTPGIQFEPAVAKWAGGEFVVVWTSYGSSGTDFSGYSIQGQRYDASGSAAGGEFQVNSVTTYYQESPAVAIAPGGDFMVVWSNMDSFADGFSIKGQRYQSDGTVVGIEFQVDSYTTDSQLAPAVAFGPGGESVVVWESEGSAGTDGLGRSIQGQRYDSAGVAAGSEFQVNSYTTDDQRFPSVAASPDGDFMVVWQSEVSPGTDDSGLSVQAQRFNSAGDKVAAQFQVNAYTTLDQAYPKVTADVDGEFLVVWSSRGSLGSDNSGSSVWGQRLDTSGAKVGVEFQVNAFTDGNQFFPSVSTSGTDFVVVWQSRHSAGTDSSFESAQGQRFKSVHSVFSDGFESGDTAAWE